MAQGSAAARAPAKTVGPWRIPEQQAAELGWSDIAAQRQALQVPREEGDEVATGDGVRGIAAAGGAISCRRANGDADSIRTALDDERLRRDENEHDTRHEGRRAIDAGANTVQTGVGA